MKPQIALGFDGSTTDDWTAIRAETLDGFQYTPTLDGLPTIWNPDDFGGRIPRLQVQAAVDHHLVASLQAPPSGRVGPSGAGTKPGLGEPVPRDLGCPRARTHDAPRQKAAPAPTPHRPVCSEFVLDRFHLKLKFELRQPGADDLPRPCERRSGDRGGLPEYLELGR